VRGASDAAARARLGELADHPRIVVHAGDVGAPHFGLPQARWRDLSRSVGHVVHAAAAVNLVLSFDTLARSNVRGALEIARFVRAGSRKALEHVSSLAVLVATDEARGTLDERSTLSPEARIFGGYAQTKLVAEALLRRAVPHVRVLRPGLLTGDSATGKGAPRCQLTSFLRQLAALGCVPDGDHERLRVDVTPVDYAARTVATLVTQADEQRLVHVASTRGASLADLIAALRRRVPVAAVSVDELRRRARAALPRDVAMALASSSYRLLGGDEHRDADLFLLTGRSFDTSRAAALTGTRCPAANEALLVRYVDAALGARP
jgi:thioester reductase-like protein